MSDILELTVACPVCSKPIGEPCATDMTRANGQLIGICFHIGRLQDAESKRISSIPPVDRSARELIDGSSVTDDHREIREDGQQKSYVVLSAAERSKGFIRPVRRTYRHKPCNSTTSMGLALAETYARDPQFYSGTFCVKCSAHFPLDQFVWEGTNEVLGA